MSVIPAELCGDDQGRAVANLWVTLNNARQSKLEEWKELRDYVFATDTTTTTNASLPWRNKTTLPKLCQIRDNLHSNYLSAAMPNDAWFKWENYSLDQEEAEKSTAIEAYMQNKTREGHFRTEMSKLLYDYIDYGNAFATVTFEARFKQLGEEKIPDFIGPKMVRLSPMDIVFNPTAKTFRDTYKIIRSVSSVGELATMSQDQPENVFLAKALSDRKALMAHAGSIGWDTLNKDDSFAVDGFGSAQEYYQSGIVEVLEFWGDYYDKESGEVYRNKVITVIDRSRTIRIADIPSWLGHAPIYHVGWRLRPDNLWAMGPLDNLVGMQYRIDHLENMKADAHDLSVFPPLVIKGEVEEFTYGPMSEIHIDENGSVEELGKNLSAVLSADSQIAELERRMEEYAGAPSEAMGIRTPGEKTAFEVSRLDNKAGRIFQEKITNFEVELEEPVLNAMLEVSRRNLDTTDTLRVMDTDLGVERLISVTKEDITATGKIRPIGARHFAAQAQLMQNLQGIFNSNIYNAVSPHMSGKALSTLIEDVLGLQRFNLFSPNAAVFEQQETARLVKAAQEDLQVEDSVPVE